MNLADYYCEESLDSISRWWSPIAPLHFRCLHHLDCSSWTHLNRNTLLVHGLSFKTAIVFLVLEIIFWPILSLLAKILSYEKITSKVQHLFVSWSTRKVPAFLACGYKKYPNICGSEFPWHEQAFSFLFNQYFTFDWKSFHLIPLN